MRVLTVAVALLAAGTGCHIPSVLADREAARARIAAAEEQRRAARAEERDRKAKLALAALVKEAAVEELLDSPSDVVAGWSTVRCYWLADRSSSLRDIETGRKYARLGGVIDLRKTYWLQEAVRRADEHVAAAEAALRDLSSPPTECSDEFVSMLTGCVTDWVGWKVQDDCQIVQRAFFFEFLQSLDPSIVQR